MSDQLAKIADGTITPTTALARPDGLAHAEDTAITRAAEPYEIVGAVERAVQKIGETHVVALTDQSGYWEAYSHGLAMPIAGTSGKSMRERVETVQDYLQVESDYLRGDPNGFDREHGDGPGPIKIHSATHLKATALRAVAFVLARRELAKEGLSVPENPDLRETIELLRQEFDKGENVRARTTFMEILGAPSETRAERLQAERAALPGAREI